MIVTDMQKNWKTQKAGFQLNCLRFSHIKIYPLNYLTDARDSGREFHWDFRVALAPESQVVNYFGLACIG